MVACRCFRCPRKGIPPGQRASEKRPQECWTRWNYDMAVRWCNAQGLPWRCTMNCSHFSRVERQYVRGIRHVLPFGSEACWLGNVGCQGHSATQWAIPGLVTDDLVALEILGSNVDRALSPLRQDPRIQWHPHWWASTPASWSSAALDIHPEGLQLRPPFLRSGAEVTSHLR